MSGGNFSEGTGQIWLSNVQCTGSERVLTNCTAIFNATDSCTHNQDVAVQCATGNNIQWTPYIHGYVAQFKMQLSIQAVHPAVSRGLVSYPSKYRRQGLVTSETFLGCADSAILMVFL